MKNIIKVFVLSLGLLALASCNDFIKQDPYFSVIDRDIYDNPKRIESTLKGLYGYLKQSYHADMGNKSFLGGRAYMAIDVRGEDVVNVSSNNVEMVDVYQMQVSDNYADNTNFWIGAYQVVNKVNVFLAGIETSLDGDIIDTDTYNQYRAEALFIRSLTFFYLNNVYGEQYNRNPNAKSILLRLDPETGTENNSFPQSTTAQVYDRILQDLSDANVKALPVRDQAANAATTYQQVTRATQAAANMLKMRVYMAMNNWDEAVKCGEAVTGYTIVGDISSLFKTPYYTTETVFSLPMNDNNVPNTQLSLPEFYNGTNNILLVDASAGIVSQPNYGIKDDDRISKLITEIDNKGNKTYRLAKFIDIKAKLDWVPIFRLAEVKLNLAEAYMNATTPNPVKAKELLTEVRRRSLAKDKDLLDIDGLSGNTLKEAIYNEKRLEFLGEGIRTFDSQRRLETISKGKNASGNPVYQVKPGDAGYTWPIPISEKLLNDAIE